jgi:hypothetical protein
LAFLIALIYGSYNTSYYCISFSSNSAALSTAVKRSVGARRVLIVYYKTRTMATAYNCKPLAMVRNYKVFKTELVPTVR